MYTVHLRLNEMRANALNMCSQMLNDAVRCQMMLRDVFIRRGACKQCEPKVRLRSKQDSYQALKNH